MGTIRARDTKPEMVVRRMAHSLGYRFRLHRRDLPGTPDMVFPGRGAVILVHGCFWHRHAGCPRCTSPGTNSNFWQEKFRRNMERDARVHADLEAAGWRVLVVWECETRDGGALARRLARHLDVRVEPIPSSGRPKRLGRLG